MAKHTLSFDDRPDLDYDVLQCPLCGSTNTHLDDVFVAGRPREDGDLVNVHVRSSGQTETSGFVQVPLGVNGAGRRHTFSLAGWCEDCAGQFAFTFTQHKGETHVSVLRRDWTVTNLPQP